jgi:hypothetical protein
MSSGRRRPRLRLADWDRDTADPPDLGDDGRLAGLTEALVDHQDTQAGGLRAEELARPRDPAPVWSCCSFQWAI